MLNLMPLKCLAQSAQVVPYEPRPQPPCAEPLPAQVEERLTVTTTVEESGASPQPVAATVVEEGQTVVETAASQAALERPAGTGSGGADVVMVPSDEDSAPSPPAEDHDVAMSSAPEPSSAAEVPEPSPAGCGGVFFGRGRRDRRRGDVTSDASVCGLPRHRDRRS
jgi:hypothetical protein